MGIKHLIEKNKTWLVPVCLAVVAISIYSIWNTRPEPPLAGPISRVYCSDNDGKSYFVEDVAKPFPFDHNGKPAYRAYVYRCGSSQPFVGLLGRQVESDSPSTQPESMQPEPAPPASSQSADSRSSVTGRFPLIEVRKPGTSEWVLLNSPEYQKLVASLCPDGSPELVLPNAK